MDVARHEFICSVSTMILCCASGGDGVDVRDDVTSLGLSTKGPNEICQDVQEAEAEMEVGTQQEWKVEEAEAPVGESAVVMQQTSC
eukprot:13878783-Ditylum_brightwellii.AAC.1